MSCPLTIFFLNQISFPNLVLSDTPECLDKGEDNLTLLNSLDYIDAQYGKFKKLWYDQYLLSLREYHKNSFDTTYVSYLHLKPGAIVLLKKSFKLRPYWAFVKIIELLPCSDNKVRVVRIQRGVGAVTTASITHLYPLELDVLMEDISVNHGDDGDSKSVGSEDKAMVIFGRLIVCKSTYF